MTHRKDGVKQQEGLLGNLIFIFILLLLAPTLIRMFVQMIQRTMAQVEKAIEEVEF